MRGEGPAQFFWLLFISAFLVNKRSQYANNLNFKLLFRLYGCKYIVYFIVYIVFLSLHRLSNLKFWRRKKVVQVLGRGGGIWTKSKRTAVFPRDTLPLGVRKKAPHAALHSKSSILVRRGYQNFIWPKKCPIKQCPSISGQKWICKKSFSCSMICFTIAGS